MVDKGFILLDGITFDRQCLILLYHPQLIDLDEEFAEPILEQDEIVYIDVPSEEV